MAEAIGGLASFPGDEMLAVQRAMLDALNDSKKEERQSLAEAFWASETAAEKYAGAVVAESTAKIVKTLGEVREMHGEMKKLQERTENAVSGYATSVNQIGHILESTMSGVHDTKRRLGFWGLVVSVLLFLGATDEILYLLDRFGRMFG